MSISLVRGAFRDTVKGTAKLTAATLRRVHEPSPNCWVLRIECTKGGTPIVVESDPIAPPADLAGEARRLAARVLSSNEG